MPRYVSMTDRRVPTLKGHVILFTAGVPREVPATVEKEVRGLGLISEDEFNAFMESRGGMALPADTEEPKVETIELQEVFDRLVGRNNPDDFSKVTGVPKKAAVVELYGDDLHGNFIADQWEKYKRIVE